VTSSVRALGREHTRGRRRRRATALTLSEQNLPSEEAKAMSDRGGRPLAVLKTLPDSPAGLEKAL
jgi:hypothetical protein